MRLAGHQCRRDDALGGDDLVFASGGDDTITGNDGNDQLWGEAVTTRFTAVMATIKCGAVRVTTYLRRPGMDELYGYPATTRFMEALTLTGKWRSRR